MTSSPATSQEDRPFATGPEIGELLPEFTLLDQGGEPVTLHQLRGDGRVFLVFVRGTDW